jgi:glycosyltransferase involved in cell wall biosynthesis
MARISKVGGPLSRADMDGVSVGLFTDSFVPVLDGVAITVRNYAFWLSKGAGRTCVVAPRVPFHVDSESYPVVRFISLPLIVRPPYRYGLPDLDLGLRRFLRKEDFSIIHAHTPFSTGHVAARTAKEKRVPLIATFHSKYRDDLTRVIKAKGIVDDQIKRIADFYYSADYVWVPQESMAATLREYGYEGPYEVMENGIDLEPPEDLGALRGRGADRIGLPEGLLAGLYVGQHILEKNLEFLVRSLPRIMEAVPEFRMVFVGQGYAKARLQRLVAELGISGKTFFHNTVHDRDLLASIYARGDLLLFPSLYDNAPLVLREAAAFSTPALLLEGSTAASVIEDGRNGFLARNDLEAYSEKAIALLKDPRDLERAGLGARMSLCRSWQDVLRQVGDRYLDILSRWPR